MTKLDTRGPEEGFSNEAVRRKRLGQYFTGTALGRVLAALGGVQDARSIVDPMAGSGDLLAACAELGADPSYMGAVEIDPAALDLCLHRLPAAHSVLGSAFDPRVLRRLPRLQWDLVIANPPYVRYQRASRRTGKALPLPSAVEVRNGLLSEIDMLPSLDELDKQLFRAMVRGYSGLADLAVPSWILSAGLVAPGGRLALVVPESWLSRDYAAVVHYLLLRWFEIEFLVEDEHAMWFTDAQVKTTLLVAKRVARREGAFAPDQRSLLRISVSGKASEPGAPFSRLWRVAACPETAFATDARKWLSSGGSYSGELLKASHVPLARIASNLRGACERQKWFPEMGEPPDVGGPVIPHDLNDWLTRSTCAGPLVPLVSLGVQVGQGLRTGANPFFYAEAREDTLVFDKPPLSARCPSYTDIALPVVRNQGDLPSGFVVHASQTPGRVLYIQNHALPEDIRAGGADAARAYRAVPRPLASLIRKTGRLNFGDAKAGEKKVWELSAVAPNIRSGRGDGAPPRFWYMLPNLAQRHRPDVLMPRINTGSPRAVLNRDSACVVDANFATLWVSDTGLDAHALLAILNSTWTAAALEHSATVMGGGALKVEAAHLRRVPVPLMTPDSIAALSVLGQRLCRVRSRNSISAVLKAIDTELTTAVLGRAPSEDDLSSLLQLAATGRERRENHRAT